jgi:hypothetical protein
MGAGTLVATGASDVEATTGAAVVVEFTGVGASVVGTTTGATVAVSVAVGVDVSDT